MKENEEEIEDYLIYIFQQDKSRPEAEDDLFSSKDRQELELPIEIFGKKWVLGILNKNHPVKEAAVDEIKKQVLLYNPADTHHKVGKFLKATTILLVRLLREKLWSIFTRSLDIHTHIFTEFTDKYKPPESELKKASNKCYSELLIRAGDPSERIGDKAEDAIKTMLKNDILRRMENLQHKLTEPLKYVFIADHFLRKTVKPMKSMLRFRPQNKEVLKQAVCKAELVLYFVKDLGDFYNVGDIIHFGVSAVKHPSPLVRQIGVRILMEMYKFDPKQVVRRLPEDTPGIRKEFVGLKNFYDEVEKHERRKRQDKKRAREGAADMTVEDA